MKLSMRLYGYSVICHKIERYCQHHNLFYAILIIVMRKWLWPKDSEMWGRDAFLWSLWPNWLILSNSPCSRFCMQCGLLSGQETFTSIASLFIWPSGDGDSFIYCSISLKKYLQFFFVEMQWLRISAISGLGISHFTLDAQSVFPCKHTHF